MVRQGVGKSYGGVEWCLKVEDGGWNGSKAAARDGFGERRMDDADGLPECMAWRVACRMDGGKVLAWSTPPP